MAPFKGILKPVPQAHSTALQLAKPPQPALTYDEMRYRHAQIALRNNEITLENAERDLQDRHWWDAVWIFGVVLAILALATLFVLLIRLICLAIWTDPGEKRNS